MRQYIFLLLLAFLSLSTPSFAQFNDNGDNQILNFDIGLGGYRTGLLGIGFANAAGLVTAIGGPLDPIPPTNPTARFTARGGILAHYGDQGAIGDLNNSTWSGLGFAGPTAPQTPYGLALTRSGSVGFYNLIPGTNGENLIAGFGNGGGAAANRFIIRSYNNAANPGLITQKDLLIANPRGAVGINNEPFAAFSVDTRNVPAAGGGVLPGVPPLVSAIAIQGDQPFPPDANGSLTSASAIGNQANASLAGSGVVVEGSRAQIPSFVPGNVAPSPLTLGVAVNLQVVADPSGGPNSTAPAVTTVVQQNREYAELTWQDLDYLGITDIDCNNAPLAAANKFFISFRNGQPGVVGNNSFSIDNKRPVMTFVPNGRVGINNINPVCQIGGRPVFLDVNGWVNSTNGFLIGSDQRFKKEVKTIESALEKVRQLRGTTYYFNQEAFPERAFDSGLQYGFIAQELEKVIPELTGSGSDGFYAVNYIALIPVLTEAIKEQDKTITELRTEVAELRQQFADFKTGQQGGDAQGFRLEQNAPNPFGQSTIIRYALPAGTTGARISVYDLSGRLLKAFPVSGTEGQVEMQANTLSDGLYIYDLQVNGKQILERKMSVVKG